MGTQNIYRIEDEPRPGGLARFAVSPFWPLLALMMGGLWLGLPWFVLNSVAVGSPTRKREWIWVGVGAVGSVILGLALISLLNNGYLSTQAQIQYALLVLVVWKLSIGYVLYTLQNSTIELYQYYGGVLNRFAPLVALAGAFLLKGIVVTLVPATLWYLVVS
ncbi:hypothetical protein PHLH6_24550 [Pseudomonas sp. Seg1]|uniref:hypothetical protein n=1 Tax=unclassified Pseudomonas TaxID=196821 RepID=UPI000CD0BF7F|nr:MULTISPECIES: hypothetical protein [unclassified Pseudomonas]POA48961.1 hypothetical protein C1893_08580 [Pseudomonas sp. MPR-ANC1]BBP70451.1 hypothetical protein PHLH6_24550 [Pseudomonas sp. Seg1]